MTLEAERFVASNLEAVDAYATPALSRWHWVPRDVFLVAELLAPLLLLTEFMLVERFDPGIAVFCITLFGLLTSWRLSHERLISDMIATGTLVRRVWLSYAIASAGSVAFQLKGSDPRALLGLAVVAGPFMLGTHGLLRTAERALRRRQPKKRTLIVGGGEIARRAISVLDSHGEYGLEVIGAVDDDAKFGPEELGAPLLGEISDLPKLVRARAAEVLIVAYTSGDQRAMVGKLREAMNGGASVWVVPRLFELGWKGPRGDHIWGLPVMRLRAPAAYRPQWALKRLFDLVLTGVGVLLLSPVFLSIATAVYFDLGRPILHRQRRITRGGRPFEMLKFRTMRIAARQVESTEWAADEARMTRLGAFLRSSSLDELPQLLNVLRGEMSLVGPRPERPHFVDVFSGLYPEYYARHRLPAGLTGWAQVHGLRGDTSIEERAAFDNYYIENWSLSKDVRILLRTLVTCLPGRQRRR